MPEGTGRSGRGGAAFLIATACGVGLAPKAPGTFGSAFGLAVAWLLVRGAGPWAVPVLAVAATAAGTWAAGVVARRMGREDPGCIVIDEVAGQAVALAFLPPTVAAWTAGFLLFRLFDIMKPPPIRRLERLPGGLGIMMDDLAAGAMANVVARVLVLFAPGLLGGA